jgi:hypothetical protein
MNLVGIIVQQGSNALTIVDQGIFFDRFGERIVPSFGPA